MSKWTRERIIREILQREAAGLPLSLGGAQPVQSTLYQAGSRVFGSWRNAVMAAGISPDKAQSHGPWPSFRILASIRSLARRKRPWSPGELKRKHGQLVEAGRRCFGSWSKAVVAAGVEPAKLRRVAPWTRERIIEAILSRALKNQPLVARNVEPRSLSEAGVRAFGSWEAALKAAGIDPKPYVRQQRGGCLITLTSGDASNPAGASPQVMDLSSGRCALANPAQRKPHQRWTDEEIARALQARARGSARLNAMAVYADERCLYRVALRRHGSWHNALVAAGLDPGGLPTYGADPNGGEQPN